ncbi:MAG: hypothetical protein CFE43_05400 [Burkholderiales bacterium PBB3]|nr:MAG: hypothetical protein CFE43_05400 [Burkholderiales bacterium PBB3]
MKPIITLISVAIATAAATAAQAQQVTGAHQQTIAPSPVQVSIHSPFKMAFDEAREFQGQYVLENGKTLTVSRKGQRLFADVVGDADVELVAISQGVFVTKDGKAEVKFQQAANGNVSGVQLRASAVQLALNTVSHAADSLR